MRANVAVRVNPRLLNRSFGLKMGGKAIQFGIDEEALDAVIDTITNNRAHHIDKTSQKEQTTKLLASKVW